MILTLKSSQCQPPNSAHLGVLRTSSKHSCLPAPSQVPWGPSGGGSVPARSPPAFHAASPARPLSPFWGDHEHSFIPFSLRPQKRYSHPPPMGGSFKPQTCSVAAPCCGRDALGPPPPAPVTPLLSVPPGRREERRWALHPHASTAHCARTWGPCILP